MIGPIKTVGIYVEDQQRSLTFFTEKLGFILKRRMPMGPGAEWLEVSPHGAESCLVLYPKSMMPDWQEKKPSIVFHCPDVEATYAELQSHGIEFKMPPTPMPWGTFAVFVDPDGNEYGLTTQEIA